jgi:hypothetical protein
MRDVLRKTPKVGDVVYYVGSGYDDLTVGHAYVVRGIDVDGDVIINDDYGENDYIPVENYGNFQVETAVDDDPGLISINIRNPLDTTSTALLDVVVDERGLKTLQTLEIAHEKATARARIEAQIKELQEELKKI